MSAETVAFILAMAIVIQSIVVGIVVIRLIPVLRDIDQLVRKTQEVLGRINEVSTNLESASQGVRQVEQRVRGVVSRVLDEVEPPVRQFAALVTGVRATMRALVRHESSGNGAPAHELIHQSKTERGIR